MGHDDHHEELARFCVEAHPQLVAALTHQIGDRGLAQELAQDALIRACDRWSEIREYDSPIGWVFRVATNLGRSWFRRRAAERRAHARAGHDRHVHEDADAADRVAVRAALQQLPEGAREIIVLRYFLGLSAVEVARTLGKTPVAIRTATHRAITRLRDELGVDLETEEGADVP